VECELHPAALQQQEETLHQAHWNIAEAWRLKAESEAVRRRYEARQARIEDLMRRYDVERA
jgi:predicted GTPase